MPNLKFSRREDKLTTNIYFITRSYPF